MADQRRLRDAARVQRVAQRDGQGGEGHPGSGAVPQKPGIGQSSAPGHAASPQDGAADAVQQHHGAHATSLPSSTTGSPSSVMVQPKTGMSKWPSVKRPANSLAPVENRKFPAAARSSVPLVSPRP